MKFNLIGIGNVFTIPKESVDKRKDFQFRPDSYNIYVGNINVIKIFRFNHW